MVHDPEVENRSLVFTGSGSPSRKTPFTSDSVGSAAIVAVGGGVFVGAGGSVGASVGVGACVAVCPQEVTKTKSASHIAVRFIAYFLSLTVDQIRP
jgi:hypothetical protein